jgi:hypothetical protein
MQSIILNPKSEALSTKQIQISNLKFFKLCFRLVPRLSIKGEFWSSVLRDCPEKYKILVLLIFRGFTKILSNRRFEYFRNLGFRVSKSEFTRLSQV